jgi:hypothetical protein
MPAEKAAGMAHAGRESRYFLYMLYIIYPSGREVGKRDNENHRDTETLRERGREGRAQMDERRRKAGMVRSLVSFAPSNPPGVRPGVNLSSSPRILGGYKGW